MTYVVISFHTKPSRCKCRNCYWICFIYLCPDSIPQTFFTKLYLWRCNLSDDHVHTVADALVTNTSVTELVLGGNAIGDLGAATLAEMLGLNPVINTLNVSYNRIGDHGLSTLAYMLKLNTVLTDVDVSHNPFGSQGADALRDAVQVNVHLLECSPLALPEVESRRRSRGLYLCGGTTNQC